MRVSRPLPPLLSLRAFEAAARLLSFSHAANELFVTQSAISHQIQKLEADLGVALFERRTRAVELTAAGHRYYARVHEAFDLLRLGTHEIRAPSDERGSLSVGILASFATRWLAPRLQAFAAACPRIDLQLRPEIALADVSGGEVDVAIRYGLGGWRGVQAQRLMSERLSLVCAPSLVAGRKRARKPQDLLRYPLLTSYSRQSFEWDAWSRRFGLDLAQAQQVQLHDYNIVVEAALAGQGIAMGRHRLIARQLESGALIEALPGATLDDARIGWWFVAPKGQLGAAATAFRDWLAATAKEDTQDSTHEFHSSVVAKN
ncbi:transcriptional regulator GcvA [Paraburkholderia sp. D15]|uniref:transcriptional regulator GcvA n=1 Tax=Paraburkholderia sp. D15 TaxID=2880218 RepID=UPI00247AD7EB|nr:transcriptional regulator GcvA [Paraburkholderia sp. D15]WGS52606.1 transcriptional regulator GcvA [Paraburkholderia sp. D15]WKF61976.1 Glycine cleavage system transcriptional activator [Paraburkholderia busanensis]